jgi:anti-anti-sigma factor
MTSHLALSLQEYEGATPVTIIVATGEIDFDTYASLLHEAETAFQEGARYLLLDMTNVTYVASAGLRAIHAILNRYNGAGTVPSGTFKSPYVKLLNPTADTMRTLSVTGFDMYIDVFTDRQSALDSFA